MTDKILYCLLLPLIAGCVETGHVFGIKGNGEVYVEQDTVTLLRNPCMGWGLYDDSSGEVQDADAYWAAQSDAAEKYASFFYVRWRWSDMEPEEGKYAWIYDDNYKKLIRGALDRGLKLCFRIYDNGQDNLRQGTPDYVRKAGAKGYAVKYRGQERWTPYPDDPVFQKKLAKFVEAFAAEYDNADIVDFIDGFCLGWWGECHHIELLDPGSLDKVFDWYTTLYSSNFKNVILALPFGSQVEFGTEKRIAIDGKGYAMRRDGLGSMWFTEEEQRIAKNMFGKTLLIGESCWWGCSDDDCTPFKADTRYNLKTWREVYELTFEHAMENHFNTLDLREIPETQGWTNKAGDLVRRFMIEGGYRIYPDALSLPKKLRKDKTHTIGHRWRNTGNGYLPNNNRNWNFKYKPAFALLDRSGKPVKIWIDQNAEPSGWFAVEKYTYLLDIDCRDVPAGKYRWAVAIIDTDRENTPGIKLSAKGLQTAEGWTVLAEASVE